MKTPSKPLSCLLLIGFLGVTCRLEDPILTESELDDTIAKKMVQYSIPGLALAIVKDEKLVYLKSFGYADKESGQHATNDNLWRIASVSKPITSIAIMKLVQDGQLTLDQKVFGVDGILGNDYESPPIDSGKDLITVRHLLDHRSGWANWPYDPMFGGILLTQEDIIAYMVTKRPLLYSPGSTYSYLNFGYCLLGRVIEKVTGKTYRDYVHELLIPMGITNMQIGGNTLADQFPDEVRYYQSEYSPYWMNVSRMDSHGGWVASAKDLARFVVRIDRRTLVPDIISPSLFDQFYFGYTHWSHFGSLPGTTSILNRLNDTLSFVVLANTRTNNDWNSMLNDLNNTVSDKIRTHGPWPAHDLFD
jgi:CubicO group peptidase (beta-lactamase class C family)